MPVCNQCDKPFPNRLVIDGVHKCLRNRARCLECSPFRDKTTIPGDCICGTCGKPYDYSRGRGASRQHCASCMVNRQRWKKKEMAIEYKGGECQLCGYKKCARNLQFHHIDPREKKFGISGSHCLAWEKMKVELDKCILLCANCHGEVEDGITNLPL